MKVCKLTLVSFISKFKYIIPFDVTDGYFQNQHTESNTDNYLPWMWSQAHYDVTNKNNNVSFEGLDAIITSIAAHPVRLAIISVMTFITAVILIYIELNMFLWYFWGWKMLWYTEDFHPELWLTS